MHLIHIGQYLSDCVHTVSAASSRYRLRMNDSVDYVPRTNTEFGEHGLFYSGAAARNTLPSDLSVHH